MKWILIVTILASLGTIYELSKEFREQKLDKRRFSFLVVMEAVAAIGGIILLIVL